MHTGPQSTDMARISIMRRYLLIPHLKKRFLSLTCNNFSHLATNYLNKSGLQQQEAEKVFVTYVKQHEQLLHKVCRMYADTHQDRQDLFQEIIIQLWKSFPAYKGGAKFSTWLYRVAINTSITRLRNKKNFISSYQPSDLLELNTQDSYSESDDENVQRLYDAIALLNEIEKALVMLYLEEKTYEEMEEILGINQGNLRVKMSRIKDKLRQSTKSN